MTVNKVAVLVERESFFLPNLLAKMARRNLIEAIIIYSPPFSIERFKKELNQHIQFFGVPRCLYYVILSVICRLFNIIFYYRFYSLSKVVRIYNIPMIVINNLDSEKLFHFIEKRKLRRIFTQINQKVESSLLDKAEFLNKHCSILPSYKGVYPIFWTLLYNGNIFGTTLHVMNEKFDSGHILSQGILENHADSFFAIYHQLYDLSADLLIDLCSKNIQHKVLGNSFKACYFSYPKKRDRDLFLKKHSFGCPLRLHAPVKPC